jgi:hypothetical protein
VTSHHAAAKWSTQSPKLRAIIKPQLPLPCRRCGRPVDDSMKWHVGHIHDLALDPEQLVTIADVGPEHQRCSTSAGGKLGAAITNQRRGKAKPTDRRMPSW